MNGTMQSSGGRTALWTKASRAAVIAAASVAMLGLPLVAPVVAAAPESAPFVAQSADGSRLGTPAGDLFGAVADLLGLSPLEIGERLRGGERLAAIAEERGVDRAELTAAVEETISGLLDRATDAGRLTELQREELGKVVAVQVDDLVERTPGRMGDGRTRALVGEMADVLGLRAPELITRLHDGESLAEIAADAGVQRSDVVAVLERMVDERLDSAVTGAGRTDDERAALGEMVADRVERLVELTPGEFRGPGGGFWRERN